MPRYFFNLRDDVDAVDPDGSELCDLAAAKKQAEAYAVDMAAASIQEQHKLNLDHRIEIADHTGALLDTVHFRNVLTLEG